jgi:hypothetical protein
MSIAALWLALWVHMVPPNTKISKFVWVDSQTPAPNTQDLIKKRRPPDIIYSLTSPSICTNAHVPIWPVDRSVGTYCSPKPKNLEIWVGELTKSCTNLVRCH